MEIFKLAKIFDRIGQLLLLLSSCDSYFVLASNGELSHRCQKFLMDKTNLELRTVSYLVRPDIGDGRNCDDVREGIAANTNTNMPSGGHWYQILHFSV